MYLFNMYVYVLSETMCLSLSSVAAGMLDYLE